MPSIEASIVTTLTYVVLSLSALVLLLLGSLVVLRALSARREARVESFKEGLRPRVIDLLLGDATPQEASDALRETAHSDRRKALEEVLNENATRLAGPEMEKLTFIFEKLGYVDEDIEALSKGSDAVKSESAYHLGVRRSVRATPALTAALSSDDPDVVYACLDALSQVGTPEAVRAITEFLDGHPEMDSLRVAEIILNRGEEFTEQVAVWLAEGGDNVQRLTMLLGVAGTMRDPRIVSELLRYLGHPDAGLRARAAEALGTIRDRSACGPLREALKDADPKVRARAAEALGRVRCPEAVDSLEACLSDPAVAVRTKCAVALTALGERGHEALDRGMGAQEPVTRAVVESVIESEQIRDHGRRGELR